MLKCDENFSPTLLKKESNSEEKAFKFSRKVCFFLYLRSIEIPCTHTHERNQEYSTMHVRGGVKTGFLPTRGFSPLRGGGGLRESAKRMHFLQYYFHQMYCLNAPQITYKNVQYPPPPSSSPHQHQSYFMIFLPHLSQCCSKRRNESERLNKFQTKN